MAHLSFFMTADSPHHVWGLNPPDRAFYHPLADKTLERIEQYGVFAAWASGYYPHRDVLSGDPDTLVDMDDMLTSPPPTLVSMSPEEQMTVSHYKTTFRWEKDRIVIPYEGQWLRTVRVVDKSTAGTWQRCRFTVIWCSRSVWEPVYGMWKVKKLVEEKKRDGTIGREVNFVELCGGNQFVSSRFFWDVQQG